MAPGPRGTIALLGLVAAALVALPVAAEGAGLPALTSLAARVLIYGIAAASLNLVLGYGGMISFGHAAFFGMGGYVVGILYHHHSAGEPLWGFIPGSNQLLVTLPAAIAVSSFSTRLSHGCNSILISRSGCCSLNPLTNCSHIWPSSSCPTRG